MGDVGKDIDRLFKSADEVLDEAKKSPPGTTTTRTVIKTGSGVPIAEHNKVVKAHNALREEHDALGVAHEELKGRFEKLRTSHNALNKELGAVKKDLKGDVARLEKRMAWLDDPTGEAEKLLGKDGS